MFLDSQAPPDRRASVQALYQVVCTGLGSLLGNLLAGEIVSRTRGIGTAVFLVPVLINLAALLALAGVFHPVPCPGPRRPPEATAGVALAVGKPTPGAPQP